MKKISTKQLIKDLNKRYYVEVTPICDECIANLVPVVLDYFPSCNFNITQIEDKLYSLKISI